MNRYSKLRRQNEICTALRWDYIFIFNRKEIIRVRTHHHHFRTPKPLSLNAHFMEGFWPCAWCINFFILEIWTSQNVTSIVSYMYHVHKKTLFLWPSCHLHPEKSTIDLLFKGNRSHKHVTNFKISHLHTVWTC